MSVRIGIIRIATLINKHIINGEIYKRLDSYTALQFAPCGGFMQFFGAIAMYICIVAASPAAASEIFVIDQSVDLYPEWFERDGTRVDLGKAAVSKIRSGDIVQGTVWFRRGHVRVYEPGYSTIYSWIEAPNATLSVASKSMALLNAAGEAFGTPFYGDALIVSAANRAAAGPFDIYGFRYRIAFDAVVSGGKAVAADFVLKPVIFNGGYAAGDIFASAVPEPSSWAMMTLGFAGLGLAMRRCRAGAGLATARSERQGGKACTARKKMAGTGSPFRPCGPPGFGTYRSPDPKAQP